MIQLFRLNPDDCIKVDEVEYSVEHQGPEGFVFRRMDEVGGSLSVSQQDYLGFLKRPDVQLIPRYFWAGRAAARLKADTAYINTLDDKARKNLLLQWAYVRIGFEDWQRGMFAKTEASLNAYMPELVDKIRRLEESAHHRGKRRYDSIQGPVITSPAPSAKSVLIWMRKYVNAGYSPIGLLRKRRSADSFHRAFSDKAEAWMKEALLDFLDPLQPTPTCIVRETKRIFKEHNRNRVSAGKPPLPEPSESTIRRRILDLDHFGVMAHRRGPNEAKRIMALSENGIIADYPMERVEMDEWEIDVLTLFRKIGVADKLDPKDAAKLNVGRRWICVAIDCATRCIVGFKISETPTSDESLNCLSTMLRDKSDIALAFDCEYPWPFHGRPETVFTDMGLAFANSKFALAMADLHIQTLRPPAKVPKLRGRIERLFGTFAIQLMELLAGRVFSNPKQRGDYPSAQQAVLDDEDLLAVFTTFIVDIYHNSKHGGLDRETPANAWKRLEALYHVTSPPDANAQRAVLGIDLVRTVDGQGVTVNGFKYVSDELANAFKKRSKHKVSVRLDPNDLGFVSIQFGNNWRAAEATLQVAHGMSLDEWNLISRDTQERHRDEAVVYEDTIARALQRIRSRVDDAMRRAGKTRLRHTTETVNRAERDRYMGLEIIGSSADQDRLPSPSTGPFGNVFGDEQGHTEVPAQPMAQKPVQRDAPAGHGIVGQNLASDRKEKAPDDPMPRAPRWRRRHD